MARAVSPTCKRLRADIDAAAGCLSHLSSIARAQRLRRAGAGMSVVVLRPFSSLSDARASKHPRHLNHVKTCFLPILPPKGLTVRATWHHPMLPKVPSLRLVVRSRD